MKIRPHLAALLIAAAPAAHAIDYLDEIVSEVHQAPGMSIEQIVERGLQCIKSTGGNAAEYIEATRDDNIAYAIVRHRHATSALSETTTRSRLSVVARDERFRVAHTDIEVISAQYGNFRLQKTWGTSWKKNEAALAAWSEKVADCILNPPDIAGGDW